MAEENGNKQCPFLGKPCIGENCELYIQVGQQQAIGTARIVGMCALPALALIISSKQLPQESILKLPRLKM